MANPSPSQRGRSWIKWLLITVAVVAVAILAIDAANTFLLYKRAGDAWQKVQQQDSTTSASTAPSAQKVQSQFGQRQQLVDKAMPYLNADNDQNRIDYVRALDDVSIVRGANYFNGRGLNTVASADMSVSDANDWVLMNIFKAWNAAKHGDMSKARTIADAVSEGQEHDEIVASLNDPSRPNVSSMQARPDVAPVYEVKGRGSITLPSGTVSISDDGAKLYAYAVDTPHISGGYQTGDFDFMQVVLRFTPAGNGIGGAWSEVATEKYGAISAANVTQN